MSRGPVCWFKSLVYIYTSIYTYIISVYIYIWYYIYDHIILYTIYCAWKKSCIIWELLVPMKHHRNNVINMDFYHLQTGAGVLPQYLGYFEINSALASPSYQAPKPTRASRTLGSAGTSGPEPGKPWGFNVGIPKNMAVNTKQNGFRSSWDKIIVDVLSLATVMECHG